MQIIQNTADFMVAFFGVFFTSFLTSLLIIVIQNLPEVQGCQDSQGSHQENQGHLVCHYSHLLLAVPMIPLGLGDPVSKLH